jgi:hypothetical protein
MALQDEIKKFEGSKKLLKDVVLLAQALGEVEPPSHSQSHSSADEKKSNSPKIVANQSLVIEKAKSSINKELKKYVRSYTKDEIELKLREVFEDTTLQRLEWKTRIVIIDLLEKIYIDQRNENFRLKVDELNKLLKKHEDPDDTDGVITLRNRLREFKEIAKHESFNQIEEKSKQEAYVAIEKGNMRLWGYADAYLSYVCDKKGTEDQILEAREVVAKLINFFFEKVPHQDAIAKMDKFVQYIQGMPKGSDKLKKIYRICLELIKDPLIRDASLDLLNSKAVASNGVKNTYQVFLGQNDTILRQSIARSLLSHNDKEISNLALGRIIKLARAFTPHEKALKFIENNPQIRQSFKVVARMALSADSEYQPLIARIQVCAEKLNNGEYKGYNKDLKELTSDIEAVIEHKSSEEQNNIFKAIKVGILIADNNTNKESSDSLMALVKELRSSASNLAGIKHAKMSSQEQVENKDAANFMFGGGLARAAVIKPLEEVEYKVNDRDSLNRMLRNWINLLFTINNQAASEDIARAIIGTLLKEDAEEKSSDIDKRDERTAERVQAAGEMCLNLKNKKAKLAFSKILLQGYCDKIPDDKIDKLLSAAIKSTDDKSEVYKIFHFAAIEEHRNAIAAALFRNSEMREWLLSSLESNLKNVITHLDPLFNQASSDKNKQEEAAFRGKAVFANWSNDEFNKLLLKPCGKIWWVHWGRLTQPNAGGLEGAELNAAVKNLNLAQLTTSQIKLLDKKSRIAILKSLGAWEQAKVAIAGSAVDNDILRNKANALTEGFDPDDFMKIQKSEAALVLAFERFPKVVTELVEKQANLKTAVGWPLLQELNDGFLNKYNGNVKHKLIVSSIYHYKNSNRNGVVEGLPRNALIEKDLKDHPKEFINGVRTTSDAFKLILRSPVVIKNYTEIKTWRGNWLDTFIEKAASLRDDKYQRISPKEFHAAIQYLHDQHENGVAREAREMLISRIPLFIHHNAAQSSEDVEFLKKLCNCYYGIFPLDEDLHIDFYKQNPLVAALLADPPSKDNNNGPTKRKVLGHVLFKDVQDDTKRHVLLEGYLNEQKGYKVPEPALLKWLRTFVWGLTIGAVTGLAFAIYSNLSGGINPSNWFKPESIADKVIGLFKFAIGATAATLTGFGLGAGATAIFAAAVVGAATCGVLFVTGRAMWKSMKSGGESLVNWFKRMIGDEALPEGQKEYEVLSSGLEKISLEDLNSLIHGDDNNVLRKNLIKNLLYISDHGFNINDNEKINNKILDQLETLCDKYRNDHKYDGYPLWAKGFLLGMENLISTPVWGIALLLSSVVSGIGYAITFGTVVEKITAYSPVTPPFRRNQQYENFAKGATGQKEKDLSRSRTFSASVPGGAGAAMIIERLDHSKRQLGAEDKHANSESSQGELVPLPLGRSRSPFSRHQVLPGTEKPHEPQKDASPQPSVRQASRRNSQGGT